MDQRGIDVLLRSLILIQYTTALVFGGFLTPSLTAFKSFGSGGSALTTEAASEEAILIGLNWACASRGRFRGEEVEALIFLVGFIAGGVRRWSAFYSLSAMIDPQPPRSGLTSPYSYIQSHSPAASRCCLSSSFSSASTTSMSSGNVKIAAIPVN